MFKEGDWVECIDCPSECYGILPRTVYKVTRVDTDGTHIWIATESGEKKGGWKSRRFTAARSALDTELILRYLRAYRDETNNREGWLGVKELIAKMETPQ